MSYHTPGPWKCEHKDWCGKPSPHDVYVLGNTIDDEHGVLCSTAVCIVSGNATSKKSTAANARLISAAPDYFDAFERFLNSERGDESSDRFFVEISKAHLKAKGK